MDPGCCVSSYLVMDSYTEFKLMEAWLIRWFLDHVKKRSAVRKLTIVERECIAVLCKNLRDKKFEIKNSISFLNYISSEYLPERCLGIWHTKYVPLSYISGPSFIRLINTFLNKSICLNKKLPFDKIQSELKLIPRKFDPTQLYIMVNTGMLCGETINKLFNTNRIDKTQYEELYELSRSIKNEA